MGHDGDTYEQYYTPTHIARDFQAIYFGTPPEDALIRSVASMGLSRDRRAPIELNDTQQKEVYNDASLVTLRAERETHKRSLKGQGFYPLCQAKGTGLYDKYERTGKKITSTYQRLHRLRLRKAIRDFHFSIDTSEIAAQLGGMPAVKVLTLPNVEFELRERATIAAMLFKPIEKDRTRVKFINALARLFPLRETRRPKATKRAAISFVLERPEESTAAKRKKNTDGSKKCATSRSDQLIERGPYQSNCDQSDCEDAMVNQPRHRYPNVPPYPVCGFCYGDKNKHLPHLQRVKHWLRRDVLNNHVNRHFRGTEYQGNFVCPYPECSNVLSGPMDFKRHSLEKHKVAH
jgi:hypothetical protein